MSRGNGTITIKGSVVGYTLYNGTVDCIYDRVIHPTVEAAWEHYRVTYLADHEVFVPPNDCEHVEEEAEYETDYGGGDSWEIVICRKCNHIVGQLSKPELEDGPYVPWR